MDTIYRLIQLNTLVQNHRAKFALAWLAHAMGIRHLSVRFDPVMACNLSCSMCFFSNGDFRRGSKGVFTDDELHRLAGMFFPHALLVVIGCGAEPTLYPGFTEIVQLAKKYSVPNVGLTTNGQLLSPEHIRQLIAYNLDEMTVSVHGVRKKTYERFMVNASFEKLHQVLGCLDREKDNSPFPQLRLNYTVNPDNLEELREFFAVYGRYNIATLQIRPIMDFEGKYRQMLSGKTLALYRTIIEELRKQAHARKITFLANTVDPLFEEENYSSLILQAVHRRITPLSVWRNDFDWRHETYDAFCERIGWRSFLFNGIFAARGELRRFNTGAWGKYSAKYEIS